VPGPRSCLSRSYAGRLSLLRGPWRGAQCPCGGGAPSPRTHSHGGVRCGRAVCHGHGVHGCVRVDVLRPVGPGGGCLVVPDVGAMVPRNRHLCLRRPAAHSPPLQGRTPTHLGNLALLPRDSSGCPSPVAHAPVPTTRSMLPSSGTSCMTPKAQKRWVEHWPSAA